MRSSIRAVLAAAALCLLAASTQPASAESGKPAANTGSSVKANEVAAAPTAGDEAVNSWMHQTLPRSKEPVRSQRAQADGAPAVRKTGLFGHDSKAGTLELLWPLLLVLGVIAGAAFVIRKVLPRGNRLGGGGVIDVVASHYLSSKQSLCLVRLGKRAVLLGVTPERITPIAEVSQPEELAEIVSAIERKRPSSFTSTFARLCAKDPGKKVSEEPAERRALAASEKMVRAGESVRDLVGRVRTLSETVTSAEPT
jgi:flagellar biosynthetic protein FliO